MPTPHVVHSLAKRLWRGSPFVRRMALRLLRFALRQVAAVPEPAATFTEGGLVARTDEFNRANELYFARLDAPARQRVGDKPFSDAINFGRHLHSVALLVHWLRLAPGDVVLELGSGTCWLSWLLNRYGCPTVSLDVSPTALEIGRGMFERESGTHWDLGPRFLVYDGHHIPLDDASVDRVVCYDAFHHVPNQAEVLAELARVLRPGGILGMIEPGRRHSLAATSRMEMDETGVLENDIVVEEVCARALAAGFSRASLVADALGAGFEIPAQRLESFMAGDWHAEYWARLCHHLVTGHFLLLYKGEFVPTTRRPEELRARIVPAEPGLVRLVAGAPAPFAAEVHNECPTRFLARGEPSRGAVSLGGHLHRAGESQALAYDYLRIPLPADLEPGMAVSLRGELPPIVEPGRYRLVLDLVADEVTWFAHYGSPTVELELEVGGG